MNRKMVLPLSVVLTCCLFMFAACSSKKQEKATGKEAKSKTFQLPEVPPVYTDPQERAKYMVAHYWDKFNFADTSFIRMPEITEQAFVDFLQMLSYVSNTEVEKGISSMLEKALAADTLMFAHFTDLYDKYLYNPNSPILNEELYIPVLKYIVNSSRVGEEDKMRPAFRLEMALKNREGYTATDFVYTLPSGKKGNLSELNADYIILFFNNPDCEACQIIKAEYKESDMAKWLKIKTNKNRQKLIFLSVFPDPDLNVWRKMLPEQPKEWMCVYDDGMLITKERLYDLRAIPTFYLLDANKTVLLKDVPFQIIIDYLNSNSTFTGK